MNDFCSGPGPILYATLISALQKVSNVSCKTGEASFVLGEAQLFI